MRIDIRKFIKNQVPYFIIIFQLSLSFVGFDKVAVRSGTILILLLRTFVFYSNAQQTATYRPGVMLQESRTRIYYIISRRFDPEKFTHTYLSLYGRYF